MSKAQEYAVRVGSGFVDTFDDFAKAQKEAREHAAREPGMPVSIYQRVVTFTGAIVVTDDRPQDVRPTP